MAIDREQSSLVEQFDKSVKADYLVHAEKQAKIAAQQLESDQAGLKSGSTESIHLTTAAASKEAQGSAQDKAEKEAKEREEDAFFLALLNSGNLDNYVAENIFGGMSGAEVADIVSMIEAETGLNFEEYAENILGDEMPERAAGESDADYHRRILIAVTDEVLNDDLTIKAGYENDPLARFVNNHQITEYARERTREADQIALQDGVDAGIAHVADAAEQSYSVARTVSNESQVLEVSDFGGELQDGHQDEDYNDSAEVAATQAYFDNFPGSDGALETASADLESQFANAAAENTSTPHPTPSTALDLGSNLT